MIIIQKEIKVSQEWINSVIQEYSHTDNNYTLSFGKFVGDKDAIINEIKKNSRIGKEILMMRYKFQKFLKEEKK